MLSFAYIRVYYGICLINSIGTAVFERRSIDIFPTFLWLYFIEENCLFQCDIGFYMHIATLITCNNNWPWSIIWKCIIIPKVTSLRIYEDPYLVTTYSISLQNAVWASKLFNYVYILKSTSPILSYLPFFYVHRN